MDSASDMLRAIVAIIAASVPSAIGCIVGIALLAFGSFWLGLAVAALGVTLGILAAVHVVRIW